MPHVPYEDILGAELAREAELVKLTKDFETFGKFHKGFMLIQDANKITLDRMELQVKWAAYALLGFLLINLTALVACAALVLFVSV